MLGIVKNHPERIQRPSYLLREDVLKLDRYIAKAKLLIDNKIETVADLQAYRESLQKYVAQLTAERKDLRNTLKRAEQAGDAPSKRNCLEQISFISSEIMKEKTKEKLCDEIGYTQSDVYKNLSRAGRKRNRAIESFRKNFSER